MKYEFKEKGLTEITEEIIEDEKSGANMLSTIAPFVLMAVICFSLLGIVKGFFAYLIASNVLTIVMFLEHIIKDYYIKSKTKIIQIMFCLIWFLNCAVGSLIIIKIIKMMF